MKLNKIKSIKDLTKYDNKNINIEIYLKRRTLRFRESSKVL
jgi:hypothetical protein